MIAKERVSRGDWVPPWLHHQHVARYEWASGFVRGKRVLDAACGIGYGSNILERAGAAHVDAFDVSDEALREARETYGSGGVTFSLGNAERLPVESASYDVYVSLETIEHIHDDRAYLAEARRVLRPHGTFICSTPNRALLNPGRTLGDRPFNPFHVREYVLDELEPRLRQFFSRIEIFGQSVFSVGYRRALTALGAMLPMGAVRAHQLRKVAGIPWESIERHRPRPLPLEGDPEVLIAACRNEG